MGRPALPIRMALLALVALLLIACAREEQRDDLDYLVWEVCRQIEVEGITAEQVGGILHDASRHGPVMDAIEAECGEWIASAFDR